MKKILLIDDNEDILHAVTQVLMYDNYRVKTLSRSAGFMAQVADFLPDLIILDYLIDDSNGGELCMLVKSSDQFRRIPVIIISGYSRGDRDKEEFGCEAVLGKPFDIVELSRTVKLLLKTPSGD